MGATLSLLVTHIIYYIIARSGQVPQSRMSRFWGVIAAVVTVAISILGEALGITTTTPILIIYIALIVIFVAVMIIFKFPYYKSSSNYRAVYREIEADHRRYNSDIEEIDDSVPFNFSFGKGKPVTLVKLTRIAREIANKASGNYPVLSNRTFNFKLSANVPDTSNVNYTVYFTLT